jgi:histone H3/H4
LSEEQVVRKAQQAGDSYFIKKSPFRKLVRDRLVKRAGSESAAGAQISNGALDTFRHAIERTIGTLIHDANNARSLATYSDRDTIYWTDILAVLSSAKTTPHSMQAWLVEEQKLFNEASDKRRLTRALGSQLTRYANKQQDE